MEFTADIATEVAVRLAKGNAEPGVFTPAAAFGPDLATAAGATFILDVPDTVRSRLPRGATSGRTNQDPSG